MSSAVPEKMWVGAYILGVDNALDNALTRPIESKALTAQNVC